MATGFGSAKALWNVWGNSDTSDPNARDAWVSLNAPRIAWESFYRDHFHPRPGEHMLIVGHTGSGKTHLQFSLLPKWPYTAAFGTKNNDSTMDRLVESKGYERYNRWIRMSANDHPRRVIWPPANNLKDMTDLQKKTFEHAMEVIWGEGGRPKENPVGWAVAMDEVWWFAHQLGMANYIKIYLQQGRSNGISLLGASQRPAFIPTEFYSQSTHLFFFVEKERRNLDRISEIDYGNAAAVRFLVNSLDQYQVLYINTRTGALLRTRAPEKF